MSKVHKNTQSLPLEIDLVQEVFGLVWRQFIGAIRHSPFFIDACSAMAAVEQLLILLSVKVKKMPHGLGFF